MEQIVPAKKCRGCLTPMIQRQVMIASWDKNAWEPDGAVTIHTCHNENCMWQGVVKI